MIKTSTYSILLDNSERTIQRWKKENRPIINFFDKYFSDDDLQEFINRGKISKLDNIIPTNLINNHFNNFINFLYQHQNDLIEFKFLLIALVQNDGLSDIQSLKYEFKIKYHSFIVFLQKDIYFKDFIVYLIQNDFQLLNLIFDPNNADFDFDIYIFYDFTPLQLSSLINQFLNIDI